MNKEYIENILNCSIGTILRIGKIMLGAFIVMVLLAVIYKVFAFDRANVNSEAVISDNAYYGTGRVATGGDHYKFGGSMIMKSTPKKDQLGNFELPAINLEPSGNWDFYNGGFEFVSKKELIESLKALSKEGLERGRYAFRLAVESMQTIVPTVSGVMTKLRHLQNWTNKTSANDVPSYALLNSPGVIKAGDDDLKELEPATNKDAGAVDYSRIDWNSIPPLSDGNDGCFDADIDAAINSGGVR